MTLLRLGANKHSGSTWFASDLLVIEETHSQSLIEIQRIIIINDKKRAIIADLLLTLHCMYSLVQTALECCTFP